ncbi:hypothetical protein HID58_082642 [Brassica napus]|uniref:Uncharacterized protein n=1 Tax=Brassica napus TaxID=3708 RepID=A0ABQ7YB03_BRANA|nr:hypothetical protein HID58_082642 [Brassica napus]
METGDHLMDGSIANTVNTELILLENQLPYIILEKFFLYNPPKNVSTPNIPRTNHRLPQIPR